MKNFHYILVAVATLTLLPASAQIEPTSDTVAPEPRVIRGTDVVIATPKAAGIVQGSSAGLKFEEAPLADVVHVVLREIAKLDYVIHPPINGTITLSTQGNVSADDAIFLLENALQVNGYQIARDARGTYHIGRAEALKGIVPALRHAGNGPLPPGFGAIVVPLKYMGAGEMATILRPMTPPDAIVRVDTVRNLLVLVGTRSQAEGWLDIVSTFDVDLLKGMSVGIFPLKNISTKDVDVALRLLNSVGGGGSPTPTTPAAPAGNSGVAATSTASSNSSSTALAASFPLFGALRVIPIDRINSVMVVTPRAAYLDEARRWLEKLDQPGGNSPDAQLFVYAVQNGNAKHLAGVLNGLFGGAASGTTASTNSGVSPALKSTTASTTDTTGLISSGSGANVAARTAKSTPSTGITPDGGTASFALTGGLRVMADEINNAVLVFGTRGEFEKVEATLKRLDIPPTQVLIEASIIEVSLTDDLQYGLQWIFSDSARGSSGLSGTGVLSTAKAAVFGATPAGFSYTLSNAAGDVRAVLNALADKSLVKVISSPSLMVLDNYEASITVGDQTPVKTGQTITTTAVTDTIQYKDTGVSLTVTPSVNAGNMVTMQLNQSVTDLGGVDATTGQRSFMQRQFTSKVAVRSGESLVLGGLIRDNTTNGKSGLPGLQDIPLFGNLFGATSKSTKRTELVVIITPRVVRTTQDAREISRDLKERMKTLYPTDTSAVVR